MSAPRQTFTVGVPDSHRVMDLVFLLGIAAVFIVNALVAIIDPSAFERLVADSPMGEIVRTQAVEWLVVANDLVLGLAIVAIIRYERLRHPVLAWAGIWLAVVTVLKVSTLSA